MVHGSATYVLSWTQTEVDGLRGRPVASVEIGSLWRWSGHAVAVQIPSELQRAAEVETFFDLSDAVRSLRYVFASSLLKGRLSEGCIIEDPMLERYLVLGMGPSRFVAGLVEMAELSRPLLLFHGRMPPQETDLLVVGSADGDSVPPALADMFGSQLVGDDMRRAGSGAGRH